MKVNETKCKSILSESKIYSVDYGINPYTGCESGCIYCYAVFMKRYTDHSEPWGEFVDVKVNAPKILEKDLKKKNPGSILISTVTDPYQPLEKKYKLTRSILDRLAETKLEVSILSKNSLVERDLDVLKKFDSEKIKVGLTINFLEEKHRKIWEPNASSIEDRIETLQKISQAGINTYVHVGPYFPNITNLKEILERTKDHIDSFMIENLNHKGKKKNKIEKVIRANYPKLVKDYDEIFQDDSEHKQKLKHEATELNSNYKTEIKLFLD